MTIWIGQNGQQSGPFSEADVRQRLSDGSLPWDVLAWREGMADWASISTLFPELVRQPPAASAVLPEPPAWSESPAWSEPAEVSEPMQSSEPLMSSEPFVPAETFEAFESHLSSEPEGAHESPAVSEPAPPHEYAAPSEPSELFAAPPMSAPVIDLSASAAYSSPAPVSETSASAVDEDARARHDAFGSLDAGGGGSYSPPFANHSYGASEEDRLAIPAPPSLHWGLVWLFSIFTIGIFGIVWRFIQANWVRKIDGESKATLFLGIGLACFVVGESMVISSSHATPPQSSGFGVLLILAYWVLLLTAYFSMANSIRRLAASHDLPLSIGGVTLFFFTSLYTQGQLTWLARWRNTGQTTPAAPKGVFWLLWLLFIPVIAILAAIALPAYNSYLIRTQVIEGVSLGQRAETSVNIYYKAHGAMPVDNATAGLSDSASMTGRYVSSVDVSGGKITVAYANPVTNIQIRDDVFVLSPNITGGAITGWSCSTDSTLPARYLPMMCRR